MVEIVVEGHQLAVLEQGDGSVLCHWSQTRVTTARVNELWCDTPAVAIVHGLACCQPHLPTEAMQVAVVAAREVRRGDEQGRAQP
jgi:hypothetical protein